MKVELVTVDEATELGLVHSKLSSEGHGAFGENENSYVDVVFVGEEMETLSEDDLILFKGESPNREVIQVISEWNSSDKILEILNPKGLEKRKEKKYKNYLKLKKEIESDDFYKQKH